MIPKVIHYCWFGRKPLPASAIKCIDSWKRIYPDYEIKEWNEDNFDINITQYTKEAYSEKRYAFVSDYARFWILYNFGGIYYDTDVETIKHIDDILEKGNFVGCETASDFKYDINPGLGMGSVAKSKVLKELLDLYATLSFYREDGSYNVTTICKYTTALFEKYNFDRTNGEIQKCSDFSIYPTDYFCPFDHNRSRDILITENTRSIHNYTASWHTRGQKAYIIFKQIFGENLAQIISKLLKKI